MNFRKPGMQRFRLKHRTVPLSRRVPSSLSHEDVLAVQMQQDGLPIPQRQYRFAKVLEREFRADFAWPQFMLLVEVQGGIWRRGGGAHSHPLDLERDVERQQYAALLGYRVCPVTTDEVTNGKAVAWIKRILSSRPEPPVLRIPERPVQQVEFKL